MTKPISIRLSEKLAAKLDELVALTGRRRAWLLERMISDSIDEELREAVVTAEVLAEVQAGTAELIDHEVVMREIGEKIRARIGDAASIS